MLDKPPTAPNINDTSSYNDKVLSVEGKQIATSPPPLECPSRLVAFRRCGARWRTSSSSILNAGALRSQTVQLTPDQRKECQSPRKLLCSRHDHGRGQDLTQEKWRELEAIRGYEPRKDLQPASCQPQAAGDGGASCPQLYRCCLV